MAKETSKAKARRAAKAATAVAGTAKVTKRAPKPNNTTQKKQRKSNTTVFGTDAPPARLRVAEHDNITAAELIVFLPNTIRSHDFLYRLMQNGLDSPTLTTIINFHRRSNKGDISINSICKIIEKTMREAGHEKWTVGKHKAGRFNLGDDQKWNPNNLTCTGFKLSCQEYPKKKASENVVLENIPFAALANGVERYPSDEDALDLTRCVKFAVANADVPFMFPRDFGFLKHLTGGPSVVTDEHLDQYVLDRWKISPREAGRLADAGVTGFEMVDHKFSRAQVALIVEYLEKVENGEEAEMPSLSKGSGSPSTPLMNLAEDSGYPHISTPAFEDDGGSQLAPSPWSAESEELSLVQTPEEDVKNFPPQGPKATEAIPTAFYPSSWSEYGIMPSAQQPMQQSPEQYPDYPMPYFPPGMNWYDSHLQYTLNGYAMQMEQPNIMQRENEVVHVSQGYTPHYPANSVQVQDFGYAGYLTPVDHQSTATYTYDEFVNNDSGSY